MSEDTGAYGDTGTYLAGRAIRWEHSGDGEFPYRARVDGIELVVRVNDFPAEPLYSLLADGPVVAHLNDWPTSWVRPGVPDDLLRAAGTSQAQRGRIDAIVTAAWARSLCLLPAGPAEAAVAALELTGRLADEIGGRRLEPPPPGAGRFLIMESGGDVTGVRVTIAGWGPSRSDLDTLLGPGGDVVRVHFDQPYPVCYPVTVAGAGYTCDVFAYFDYPAGPPAGPATAESLLFRRQVS